MKRLIAGVFCLYCLFAPTGSMAQKFHNDYYDTRRAVYEQESVPQGSVIFLGDSITEQGWWNMLFKSRNIVNRGIGGDNTFGIIDRLPQTLESAPSRIFLLAGVNDITGGQSVETIVGNIGRIADMVHETVPGCKLYIQSLLPVSTKRLAYPYVKGHNPQIKKVNARLAQLCEEKDWCTFVNLAPLFSDADGELRAEMTKDGIHLYPEAYAIWADHLKKLKYLK